MFNKTGKDVNNKQDIKEHKASNRMEEVALNRFITSKEKNKKRFHFRVQNNSRSLDPESCPPFQTIKSGTSILDFS